MAISLSKAWFRSGLVVAGIIALGMVVRGCFVGAPPSVNPGPLPANSTVVQQGDQSSPPPTPTEISDDSALEQILPIRRLGSTSTKMPLSSDPVGILLSGPSDPILAGSQFDLRIALDVGPGNRLVTPNNRPGKFTDNWEVQLPVDWATVGEWKQKPEGQGEVSPGAGPRDNPSWIEHSRQVLVPRSAPAGPYLVICHIVYQISQDTARQEAARPGEIGQVPTTDEPREVTLSIEVIVR